MAFAFYCFKYCLMLHKLNLLLSFELKHKKSWIKTKMMHIYVPSINKNMFIHFYKYNRIHCRSFVLFYPTHDIFNTVNVFGTCISSVLLHTICKSRRLLGCQILHVVNLYPDSFALFKKELYVLSLQVDFRFRKYPTKKT